MIYGKLWLVVKPSVGIPLFLGAVAVGSFAVHLALLTNTTWVKRFLNGSAPAVVTTADAPTTAPPPKR
jgi:light-harvesting protein B-800-850 alpha chain